MSPDEVCGNYSGRDVQLSIRVLEGDVVLLEGDRVSLEFLAELIRGQSTLERDDGFSIEPNGAGRKFFAKSSRLGLYIHRIDQIAAPEVPEA
ncbi:MAG TPA: hypothetical protein VLB76_25465 [Thermoanaerobaculia bacterium]|jgi:hypothetical protein|nr:hypothetical protein [Thermoanaerobaculia bacterium]